MKPTTVSFLAATALIAGGLSWLAVFALVANGRSLLLPPFTVGIALLALAALLLVLAWPVRGAARGTRRVDDRFAVSVLGFAKASALTGALLYGAATGAVLFLATGDVPASEMLWRFAAVAAAALVQTCAGFVAERWCRLPPDASEGQAATGGVPHPAR